MRNSWEFMISINLLYNSLITWWNMKLTFFKLFFQFGTVYDIKPAKIAVEKNHLYEWCGCGRSHSQPFCDVTCQNPYWRKNIVGGKITYIAPKSEDVWFCLCKHTKVSIYVFISDFLSFLSKIHCIYSEYTVCIFRIYQLFVY